MTRPFVWIAAAASLGALVPAPARAQGYGVYEQGTCTMARAGAAVASPCADGSAIFFNPAALADIRDGLASVGLTLIAPSGDFTNTTTGRVSSLEDRVYPVPHGYVAQGIGERYTAGFGVFAPYGLETNWPTDAEGRFLGYKSVVQAIYLQPTAAMRLTDRISIGAGFDLSLVHVQLRQRLDLAEQSIAPGITFGNLGVPSGTDFADVNLTGNATGAGYHVGVQVKPADRVSVGVRYLSRQLIEIDDGEADITPVPTGLTVPTNIPSPADPAQVAIPAGTPVDAIVAPQFLDALADQRGSTYLRFPEQLVVGAAFQATPQAKLLFDYQYTNWTVFEELPITFERLGTVTVHEGFRTAHGFRVGGEYQISPATAVRVGYYTHGAAAPPETVTPNLPEGERSSFTAGVGTGIGARARLDLAYQYIDQADRAGRSTDGGLESPTVAVNNGIYQFHAHLVGATVGFDF